MIAPSITRCTQGTGRRLQLEQPEDQPVPTGERSGHQVGPQGFITPRVDKGTIVRQHGAKSIDSSSQSASDLAVVSDSAGREEQPHEEVPTNGHGFQNEDLSMGTESDTVATRAVRTVPRNNSGSSWSPSRSLCRAAIQPPGMRLRRAPAAATARQPLSQPPAVPQLQPRRHAVRKFVIHAGSKAGRRRHVSL
jgi:hypothetical protein